MRRLAWCAVLAPLLVGPVGLAKATPHRRALPPRCSPARRRLLAADRQAQIYTVPAKPEGPGITDVFGCAYGHRAAYKLGFVFYCTEDRYTFGPSCFGIEHEVLAGPIVAYEQRGTPCSPACSWRVLVRDLRTGRLLRREPTGSSPNPAFEERVGVGWTTGLVVKSNGSVAWIALAEKAEGSYQVHAADTTGTRLLASGEGIDPSSLALAGSTLYWTQAGKPFSAPLD
jgi:hypothetical protein